MSDSQITIFYSWQSDLPGSETRNIIQDSIKDAVRLLRDKSFDNITRSS